MPIVKPATLADISAVARVDVETWRSTYPGMLPDRYLIGLSERPRAASWLRFVTRHPGDLLIAVDDRQAALSPGAQKSRADNSADTSSVVGFGSCGPQRERDIPYTGEIFTLYVAPDWQGQGVGRALLRGLFERLIRDGRNSAAVWVLAENNSRFFYQRLGGRQIAAHPIHFGNGTVDAVAYGWPDLSEAIAEKGVGTLAKRRGSGSDPEPGA